MNSRVLFSVCGVFLAFCVLLGSCSRYLPTKRSPGPVPSMQDYDQDLYPRGAVSDQMPYVPDMDNDGYYSVNAHRPKLTEVIAVPVHRRPRNQPEAYYSRW